MLVKYGLFCVNGNINFCHRLCSLETDVESEFGVQDFYWVSTLPQGRKRSRLGRERGQLVLQVSQDLPTWQVLPWQVLVHVLPFRGLDHQDGSPLYHQLAESLSTGFPRNYMTSGRTDLCNWQEPWKSQNLEAVCWSCSLTARQQILPWKSSWAVHLRVCHGLCYFSLWVRRLLVGWTH